MIHKGTRDNNEINVYECHNCGTKFLSKVDKNYNYETGFMHESNNILTNLNIEDRLKIAQEDDMRRYEMLKELCFKKKILDFGCGFGGFLHYISKIAKLCSGVELGKIERKFLNENSIQCFKTLDEYKEKFDVITLFHVFEHLSHPREWLNKFSEYLETDGYLVIEVPNANDILLSLYESKQFADFTYWSAHLFLYTIESLSMIIRESNKYSIKFAGQIQRYSIANHLMWLSKGIPGGHKKWNYLDSEDLNAAYFKKLNELKMCDTLFFVLQLNNNYK